MKILSMLFGKSKPLINNDQPIENIITIDNDADMLIKKRVVKLCDDEIGIIFLNDGVWEWSQYLQYPSRDRKSLTAEHLETIVKEIKRLNGNHKHHD